jgi:hypothetical protein
VFLGTIGNAGLSEARKWSIPVWMFTSICMTLFFIKYFHINQTGLLLPLLLFTCHGFLIGIFSLKMKFKKANASKPNLQQV